MTKKVAIFISGSGSNMVALVKSMQSLQFALPTLVLSNKRDAAGLIKAKNLKIPTVCVEAEKLASCDLSFEATIQKELEKSNIQSKFIRGLRVTDERVINIVETVLINFNNDIVASLKKNGSKAISINTKNNNIIEVIPEVKELGFVGTPNKINNDIIINILNQKKIPIISPLGLGKNNQSYNINGDTAAGAIAKSLKSRRLLLMTNVEGVLNKEKKLIEEISSSEIVKLIEDKTITEGMIPKINTCLDAVNNGVTAVGIIDGRKQHSLLFEIFSDKGSGTLIRK